MTEKPEAGSSSRANVAALVVIILIVGALLWVGQAMIAHNRLQDCIDSGRRDCLPAPG